MSGTTILPPMLATAASGATTYFGYGYNPGNGSVVPTTENSLLSGITTPPTFPSGSPLTNPSSTSGYCLVATALQVATAVSIQGSLSGTSGVVAGSASASLFFSTTFNGTQIALNGTVIATYGSFLANENGTPADSWNPEALTSDQVANLMQALDGAGSYDAFVETYGAYFIGGWFYGASYNYVVELVFESVQAQAAAAAALGLSGPGIVVSGDLSVSTDVFSTMTAVTATTTEEGGFQPPEAVPTSNGSESPLKGWDKIAKAIDKNVKAFNSFNGTQPLLFQLYDWRIIPQVMTWINANQMGGFDPAGYASNLASFINDQEALTFLNNWAAPLPSNPVYGPVGDTSAALLASDLAAMGALLTELKVNETATNFPNFIATYESASTQIAQWQQDISNIQQGQATFSIAVTLNDTFDLTHGDWVTVGVTDGLLLPASEAPAEGSPPPLPANYFMINHARHGKWDKHVTTPETWCFGFTYYGQGQLYLAMGYVENGQFQTRRGINWWTTFNTQCSIGTPGTQTFTLPVSSVGSGVGEVKDINVTITIS